MRLSKIKKIVLIILSLFVIFFVATEVCILKYLKEYGYGISKLPETTLVYFHLSKGVTVHCNNKDNSIFIGRHDYIYDDIFSENGYSLYDQMGENFYYKNDNNSSGSFCCYLTTDWCHWFRIYKLSPRYKIEDFK
ncbi:MAG: hypothetical protein NC040_02785 [Muribaculaceae bacterium]|nr:hypothetical protein [Alistipes senegalensis]MCM1472957.1 hypothetical protein [Muribaculaceae bacterium]